MKILYVYAHPNPKSFNAKLMQTALHTFNELGTEVNVSNLYAQQFKSLADNHDFTNTADIDQQYFAAQHHAYKNHALTPDITSELEKIAWAEHIIFQFPLWWFNAPAILKGWFDRVFIKGFAYDTQHMFADGLLKNKTASFVVTTQSSIETYQRDGVHGHGIEDFLLPITHTLNFSGIKIKAPFIAYSAFELNACDVKNITNNYKQYLVDLIENAA